MWTLNSGSVCTPAWYIVVSILSSILVVAASRNLQMRISPEEPVEGEEFTFTCNSEGAEPPSIYEYAINGRTVTDNKYTAITRDREGVTLSCTDMEYSNWKQENTKKAMHIIPRYIASLTQRRILYEKINPDSDGNGLSCSDQVEANPPASTFEWEIDGIKQTEPPLSYIILTPKKEGTMVVVKCRAGNGLGKTVTITWYILWSETAEFSMTCPSTGAVLGGVIGSIILIIALIIITLECWWRIKDAKKPKKRVKIGSTPENYTALAVVRRDRHRYTPIQAPRPPKQAPEATKDFITEDYLTPITHNDHTTEDYSTSIAHDDTHYVDMDGQEEANDTYESVIIS